MSKFLQSLVSGSRRPLLLRMRADLSVQQQQYLGREYFVVKDPLSLKYFRFEAEEFAILNLLDGKACLEELRQYFEHRFAPQKISLQELHRLIGMLHRASLVVSDSPGQGQQLLDRQQQRSRQQRLSSLTNLLNLRFRGFDPDRLLGWLNQRVGWFFSWPCFVGCLALAASALLLIFSQFDVFTAKLPAFHDFFASDNWVWLAIALAATKILHEFGHGLSCKRFGGECHEMGVMLLILTPCLYCNVSDSWMLPNKWKRAAIGAAGMYVELVLASLSTFLWWFTHPGMLNYLCLNVMVVCSVSTLLFNANPLLRYDGYYILADLLEIPNLRQKADAILQRKLAAWLFGLPETPDPFLPRKRLVWFAMYSVAAAVYRWVVVFAVLWFLYRVFEPYGLQIFGQIIACLGFIGLLVQPILRATMFLRLPGRIDRMKKRRVAASGLVGVAIAIGVLFIPLPHAVRCTLYLKPRDSAAVYVESAGALQEIHVQPGDRVQRGQPIVSLLNIDVQAATQRLIGERQRLESRLNSLRQRAFEDEHAAMEVGEAEKSLVSIAEQIAAREQDVKKLIVISPAAGVVLPAPTVSQRPDESARLPSWSGTPFESRNLTAFLVEGTPICQIGDPTQMEAILAIDERDVEFLCPGQLVDIFLAELPGRRFRSHVEQLSQVDMKVAPRNLSSKSGGDLVSRTDESGQNRPLTTTYQANAFLNDEQGVFILGATGEGKIHTRPQTIARRLWRFVTQTFNFDA